MATSRCSCVWIGRILKKLWKGDPRPETTKRYLQQPEMPQMHVQLVEQCLHQVQGMTSEGSNVQFHHEQCRYLVHKLETVVTLIRSKDLDTTPLSSSLPCPAEKFLKVWKLLYQLVNEAESFIRNCCKDEWIQTAVILTDVSKHVATRAFQLELVMLRLHKILGGATVSLERTELETLYTVELKSVQAAASLDRGILVKRLEKVIHDSNNPKNEQFRLATYVLQRLGFQQAQPHSSHWEVDLGSLQRKETLGSLQRKETLGKGGMGTLVQKTIWLGAEVAAKTFYGEELHPIFLNEVSILQHLSHSNIMPLLCYATNKREDSIIMELMDSDLHFLIQERFQSDKYRNVPFTMEESVDIMLQVAEAMNHIHERRILHRDLKSHNILVKYVKGKGVLHVKVADFGISKEQEHSSTFSCQSLNKGSTRWMAPEVIAVPGQAQSSSGSKEVLKYPFKSDIYSFGMLCYEILTGKDPFWETGSHSQVKSKVLHGDHPELPLMCPVELKTLIMRCWKFKASVRPSFAEICKELQYIHWCLFLAKRRILKQWFVMLILGFLEQDQERMEKPVWDADFQASKYGPERACKSARLQGKPVWHADFPHFTCSGRWCLKAQGGQGKFDMVASYPYPGSEMYRSCKADNQMFDHMSADRTQLFKRTLGSPKFSCKLACDMLDRTSMGHTLDRTSASHLFDDPSFGSMILEDISNLKLKRRLGQGGSDNADVFLSTWHHHSNAQDVAQKMFLMRPDGNGSFKNEVSIMAKLNHPNIVQLLCYAEDERTQSLVMELMDGDLNDLLRKRLAEDTTREVPFSMNEAVDVMLQIAAAMNYLHQNNVVHRDLKSDNILFRNVKEGKWNMKVADFGLSKDLGSHDKFRRSRERAPYGTDVSYVTTYRGNIGTIRWMAPELMIIHGNEDEHKDDAIHISYGSDVYSFAMVCSEILTGHVPFSDIQDPSEVQTKVLQGERPMLPNECNPKLRVLIGHCWHPKASLRPKFTKIIEELEGILLEQHNGHSSIM